jgi:endonuclease/exonuclease/phosphatase family metal-dependent hydrolase
MLPSPVAALRITPLPVAPPVAAIAPLPSRPASPPIVTPLPSAAPVASASPPPVVLPQRLPPQPLPQQAALPSPQVPSPQQAPLPQPPAASPAPAPPAAAPATGKPTDAITIASFNIQVFGESKIAKPQVVDVLARVVRGCDIVAIQEVRAKSDHVIPQFLEAVNADGSRYQFVIGPRLGRTASKEQYVFMYDTTRIEIDPSSVATVPNPGDRLHRPPMVARFRVRTSPPESGFSFWLVDIHTDPDEVPQEVDALADVFVAMRSARPDEDDVILLGDLNAGPPQFGRLGQIPGIGWAVSGVTTNTRRSKTYDNIIFDRAATSEYTGRWGVLDLQNTFGLSLDQALTVSDHNPVWACFRPWETQRTGSLPAAPQSQ